MFCLLVDSDMKSQEAVQMPPQQPQAQGKNQLGHPLSYPGMWE